MVYKMLTKMQTEIDALKIWMDGIEIMSSPVRHFPLHILLFHTLLGG